jgi:uncharacterized membrane protein
MITHPFESIKILFINHVNEPLGDYVKLEFFVYLLISGFFLLFRKPMYIFMLIPVFFQKMFHDNYLFWSTQGQYSIEFVSIMVFGIFGVIAEIHKVKLSRILLIAVIIGNLAVSFRVMDQPIVNIDRVRIRFYQKQHYEREFNAQQLHQKLKEIPSDAIVSAQTSFHPHLAWRESIYQYPNIADANFIIISEYEHFYPLDQNTTIIHIENLKADSKWNLWYEKEGVYIFKLEE